MAAFADIAFARDTAFSILAFDFGTSIADGDGGGSVGFGRAGKRGKLPQAVSPVPPRIPSTGGGMGAHVYRVASSSFERDLDIARERLLADENRLRALFSQQNLNEEEAIAVILIISQL